MYTPSIVIDQIIDALAAFLEPFVDGAQIVRAQVNRVPMPQGACVVLTERLVRNLATPTSDYQPLDNTATVNARKRFEVQIDFYGPLAGEQCGAVEAALRSPYGFDSMPVDIKPLYTSEGIQAPLITGEEQYESRWTLTAYLQYNPVVTLPQQFADEAHVTGFTQADA